MIMKKLACLILIVVLVAILAACAELTTATPTTINLIKPGDTINGVLVTTGTAESTLIFDLPCTHKDGIDTCITTLGNLTIITLAVYGTTPEEFQSNWDTLDYSLTIDDHPIDLPAFGTVDFVHERTGLYMRAYNVALISTDPITLTMHDIGSIAGESFEDNFLLVFKPVVDDPIQPLSTAFDHTGQHTYTSETANFELLLYLPGEYGQEAQQTWPLILFLHGFPNITKLDWVRIKPIAVRLDNQLEFPFIVASPLHAGEKEHWSQPEVMDELLTLLAELQADFNINPQQIYLSGILEGANGTWELGLAHPDLFAALAPVTGYMGYPFTVPDNICDLKDMPIWAFHGEDDTAVPLSAEQMLVDALRTCGNDKIKFTVYPDAGHEIYLTAFADPNLYTWLLEQSK
jgi:hypothetical protein